MALIAYELLVRNDHLTGVYKGSHVKFFDTATMKDSDAMSLEKAAALGYPLNQILTSIETGAIMTADSAVAARVVAESAKIDADTARALAESALLAEKAAHDVTRAALAALTIPK